MWRSLRFPSVQAFSAVLVLGLWMQLLKTLIGQKGTVVIG
jgi:hypothetical protein